MSNWREQFEGETGYGVATAWLGQYYHYVTLALLLAFAFWNRARNWSNFVTDGRVLFRGNDPWYHYRSVQYTVNNFPQTMPYEVWTRFPVGTSASQFGTFFDQLMATIALVVGLGSPGPELVKRVVLISPALFGMLVLVPAYFIGRRLGGRFAGILAAAVLAFAPDGLLARSVVGFSDHHVAEALFQAVAVLGVMVALSVAQKEKPVYELLIDREFDALRRPLGYAGLAGVGIATYLWTWPPGVLLLGILGVFFVVHLSLEVVRGQSPEHTALVGAVALAVAGVLQLSTLETFDISATARSALQPGLAFAVAFGCVFMAWLFREWEQRELPRITYPAAIAGVLIVGAGFMAVALPDLYAYFVDQVLRVVGFETSPTAGTVGEAQPLRDPSTLYGFYRLTLFTAIGGFVIVLFRQAFSSDPSAEGLLVAILFVFILAATFTQARFAYYLAVPVAALTAVTVGSVMQFVGRIENLAEIESYQVMTVFAVLVVVLAPMFIGAGASVSVQAMDRADGASQPGGVAGWAGSLDWMANNTPAEGQYANADGEQMEYYGTFARTEDHDYPEGAYGVMSWWDYGHWITVQGERIPNANPFQQASDIAAKFLTAQSEQRANEVLDNNDEDDAKTRYVTVDWKMVETETQIGGKYFAPLTFNPNTSRSEFYARVASVDNLRNRGIFGGTTIMWHKQPYHNSTAVRLYRYHGSAMDPEPVVLDWQGQEQPLGNGDTFVAPSQDGQPIKRFETMAAARSYVQNDSTSQIGGFGPYPEQRVPALEHYRLVHMSERSGLQGRLGQVLLRDSRAGGLLGSLGNSGLSQGQLANAALNQLYPNTPSWVKTFERVPGATVEGSSEVPNATIEMAVGLNPQNGDNFTYRQRVQTDENGDFTATVPYATDGYDELGPDDGYTNTSVRALGDYRFALVEDGRLVERLDGTASVSEAQVVGADDDPVQVTLERSPDSDGNTADGTTDGNTTDGSSDGDATQDETSDNQTQGSIASQPATSTLTARAD